MIECGKEKSLNVVEIMLMLGFFEILWDVFTGYYSLAY